MSGELRVALVGTGGVAHQHMKGYRSAAGDVVKVVAACDPRAEVLKAFAEEHRIPRVYREFGNMLDEEELDIVALLTPPGVRDEIIYPSLARGVNLLVEKPFATTGPKAVEYALAAERAGVHLAVSQNFRWFPEHQWLKERLGRADAARISYLEARSFQNRPQATGQWRAEEPKLEMAIFSVHLIDRLQWIADGTPVAVSALTRRRPGTEIAGEQLTTLIIDFDDGSVGHLTSSWLTRGLPVNDLRVDTDTGSAHVWREQPMRGTAFAEADFLGGRDAAEFPDSETDPQGPRTYGLSIRELASAIRDGRTSTHSGRDNLRTMGIMEAAYLSAAHGGDRVTIAEALGGYVDVAKRG